MAFDYDKFVDLYRKHLVEQLAPKFQEALEKECKTGSGKIWSYISKLVIRGADEYVYAVYKPKKPFYKRRGSKRGGIGDPKNVEITTSPVVASPDGIEAGITITNLTMAGTIYERDEDGVLHAVAGGGELIEDDILGGTGYRFPLGRGSSGSFRVPRNFYQVYDDEYDEEYAGNLLLASLGNKIEDIKRQAMLGAIADMLNNLKK